MNQSTVKYYATGYSGNNTLIVDGCVYSHLETGDNGYMRLITCNSKDKTMYIKEKKGNKANWEDIDFRQFRKGTIIDPLKRGPRWEGDTINQQPFGFGSYYNEKGKLIYIGFMYNDMKVCFGNLIYPASGIVEYSGTFYKNHRYGYGVSYSRKNKVTYEGEWFDDKPIDSLSVSFDNSNIDGSQFNFSVKEIIIGNKISKRATAFTLIGFSHLTKLKIGNECFSDVTDFQILFCDELQVIEIGEKSFVCNYIVPRSDDDSSESEFGYDFMFQSNMCEIIGDWEEQNRFFRIMNCRKLKSITIGNESFGDYSSGCELGNLPSLESLEIGEYCFYFLPVLKLHDLPSLFNFVTNEHAFDEGGLSLKSLPKLSSYSIGENSLQHGDLVISDLPALTKFTIDGKNFSSIKSLTLLNLSSLVEINLYRSSYSHAKAITLSNLPVLTALSFGERTFENVEKLIIANLPSLAIIKINSNAFTKTKLCILNSKTCNMLIYLDLPKCVHISIEAESLFEFFSYSFSIDLPSLSVFSIAKGAFCQTSHVILENIPFATGIITWGNEDRFGKHSFSSLRKSEIQSDEKSTRFHKMFCEHIMN